MTKISNLSITGLRGVRKKLSLPLDAKSSLLYGDNGTGKSTISDAVEWFYHDKIEHLATEEIGRKGHEALRNIYLDDADPASVEFEYDTKIHNCTKSIEIKSGKLETSLSNSTSDFVDYLTASQQENLVLRYRDLVRFVILSKGERLRYLSEIIGFGQVTKTRDILQKVTNQLSREITNKNFENQINHQQSQILEQFGHNVTSDKEFIKAVELLIKDFKLGIKMVSVSDVNTILTKIKKPDDSKEIKQETYLTTLDEKLVDFPVNLAELEKRYKEYRDIFEEIVSDLDKVKKLALEKLLRTGQHILINKTHDENTCPLCLQNKSQSELISELSIRLKELEETRQEDHKLGEAKNTLKQQISLTRGALQAVNNDVQSNEAENANRKKELTKILNGVAKYEETLEPSVLDGKPLPEESSLLIDKKIIQKLEINCKSDLSEIRKKRSKDPKWDAQAKISIAGHAYAQIRKLSKEQSAYETQRNTMDEVFRLFLQAQKDGLELFLNTYSTEIDEIYQFLNPGERVENIRIVPIEKNGVLVGLTIEYDFLDVKSASPPHKYLSESHLNCLGIAVFLASVEAFNQQNKFLILDDVISSFDTEHRKRFADLIVEEYSDYQVIILTHERSWFEIVANLVKKKGWSIYSIKYNDADGTHLDDPPKTLEQEIKMQIAAGGGTSLGNNARKFLENRLKSIAHNLEVKVAYRPNEVNEDRMSYELLTELKGKLKRAKCVELTSNPIIDRLINSTNIGNKDSHDHFAAMAFGDIKAFWQDIKEFEELFYCEDCASFVSIKNLDTVNQKARCRKGHLTYSWKI